MIALTYAALIFCVCAMVFQFVRFCRLNRILNIDQGLKKTRSGVDLFTGFLNTIFQVKLFKAGKIRWLMHFLVLTGFFYLLFVHALHSYTAPYLFDYYDPTIDPFQFLRNFFGLFVLLGALSFAGRRVFPLRINQDKKIKFKGIFSIVLILIIVGTGFMLEASKIISEPVFMEMVEEYSDITPGDGLEDLKLYWQQTQTVFFNTRPRYSPEKIENGEQLSETYCASCHSDIRSSFVSRPLARLLSLKGEWLNLNRADHILYYIHYLSCLLLLVSLPFGRIFHVFLIPFSSFRHAYKLEHHKQNSASIHTATLYACTNCGVCSQVCSVYPHYQVTQNIDVLPHSKIESIKKIASGNFDPYRLEKLAAGNEACTMCHRCTQACPSGIDLQTLWSACSSYASGKDIITRHEFFDRTSLKRWSLQTAQTHAREITDTTDVIDTANVELTSDLADKTDAFESCIQCTICTNVCPVVANDASVNDYTPQQIMNLLRLGQKTIACATHMVWNCLTCYACQEICPQQIRVTDILLELRQYGSVQAGAKTVDMKKNEEH